MPNKKPLISLSQLNAALNEIKKIEPNKEEGLPIEGKKASVSSALPAQTHTNNAISPPAIQSKDEEQEAWGKERAATENKNAKFKIELAAQQQAYLATHPKSAPTPKLISDKMSIYPTPATRQQQEAAKLAAKNASFKSFKEYIEGDALNCNGVTDVLKFNMTEFSEFMDANLQIKHLKLSKCDINFSELHWNTAGFNFSCTIRCHPFESIDFSYNNCAAINFYVRGLRSSEIMKSLNFANCHIDFNKWASTITLIAKNYPNLEYLNFSNNIMVDEFITQSLCQDIKDGLLSKCKTLDISDNYITLETIKELIEIIKESNCSITTLKCANHLISAEQEGILNHLLHPIDADHSQTNNKAELEPSGIEVIDKAANQDDEKDLLDVARIEALAIDINKENYDLIISMLQNHNINNDQAQYLASSFQDIKGLTAEQDQAYLSGLIEMLTHPDNIN